MENHGLAAVEILRPSSLIGNQPPIPMALPSTFASTLNASTSLPLAAADGYTLRRLIRSDRKRQTTLM